MCHPRHRVPRACSYFLRDGVKEPLGIGDVLLEDASVVKGFIGEAYAVAAAPDITHYGGWRAYLAASQK
jgi:allophanate hydrolase